MLNVWKKLTIFGISSILVVWQGSKYVSKPEQRSNSIFSKSDSSKFILPTIPFFWKSLLMMNLTLYENAIVYRSNRYQEWDQMFDGHFDIMSFGVRENIARAVWK